MTRETKIGLLVGLAFIIVIGILLSDHLTSSTDPPPAMLTNSGSSVRDTIRTPGGTQPPVQPVVVTPQVSPESRVLTQGDLDAQKKAEDVVRINVTGPAQTSLPPSNPGQASITRIVAPQPPAAANPPQQVQPRTEAVAEVPRPQNNSNTGHPIERIAAEMNQPIVALNNANTERNPTITARSETTPSGVVEYTAQAGDTLSRIAAKLMGANTKANREAIVKANASLQANPDMVVVGRSYRIPSASSTVVAAPPAATPSTPTVAAQQNGANEYWYTVKEGDTLTRIAREQLGMGEAAVPSLVEINRDTIKNPDSLQINSRIRLPGRPVAQIN